MPRWFFVSLFVTIAAALTAGVHLWFYRRLVRDAGLPSPWQLAGRYSLVGMGALIPVTMLARRALPDPVATAMAWPVFVWMGMMLLLSMALGVGELARLGTRLAAPNAARPVTISRSRVSSVIVLVS